MAVTIPGMSEYELELLKKRVGGLDLGLGTLQKTLQQSQALSPALLKEAGYDTTFTPEGTVAGITKLKDPNAALRKQIEEGFNLRSLQALKGGLPDNPQLVRQITEARQQLEAKGRKQLGTGYEWSTPYTMASRDFETSASESLDAARRKDLEDATRLGLQTAVGSEALATSQQNRATGAVNLPVQNLSQLSALSAGYGGPEDLLQRERLYPVEAQLRAEEMNNLAKAGLISGGLQGLGSLAGAVLGAPAGGVASKIYDSIFGPSKEATKTDGTGGTAGTAASAASAAATAYGLLSGAPAAGTIPMTSVTPLAPLPDMSLWPAIPEGAPGLGTLAPGALSTVAPEAMATYSSLVASGMPPAEAALSAFGSGAAATLGAGTGALAGGVAGGLGGSAGAGLGTMAAGSYGTGAGFAGLGTVATAGALAAPLVAYAVVDSLSLGGNFKPQYDTAANSLVPKVASYEPAQLGREIPSLPIMDQLVAADMIATKIGVTTDTLNTQVPGYTNARPQVAVALAQIMVKENRYPTPEEFLQAARAVATPPPASAMNINEAQGGLYKPVWTGSRWEQSSQYPGGVFEPR